MSDANTIIDVKAIVSTFQKMNGDKMKVILEENPITILPDCNKKLPRTVSMKVRKLEVKDGKIICPDCGELLTGKIFIDV